MKKRSNLFAIMEKMLTFALPKRNGVMPGRVLKVVDL
jgi:hypothetical protein